MTTELQTTEKTKSTIRKKSSSKIPSKYKVLVLNDDVTTIEFVVAMLVKIFRHSPEAALDLALKIHKNGSAVAGIYSFEIAEQKSIDATNMARLNGYPLVTNIEPV